MTTGININVQDVNSYTHIRKILKKSKCIHVPVKSKPHAYITHTHTHTHTLYMYTLGTYCTERERDRERKYMIEYMHRNEQDITNHMDTF